MCQNSNIKLSHEKNLYELLPISKVFYQDTIFWAVWSRTTIPMALPLFNILYDKEHFEHEDMSDGKNILLITFF